QYLDVALEERFTRVISLELRGLRGVYLVGLRYVTAVQLEAIDQLAEAAQHLLEQRPLLLPATDYRLTLRTETETIGSDAPAPNVVDHYLFFRTAGPPTDLPPYLAATLPGAHGAPRFRAHDLAF